MAFFGRFLGFRVWSLHLLCVGCLCCSGKGYIIVVIALLIANAGVLLHWDYIDSSVATRTRTHIFS